MRLHDILPGRFHNRIIRAQIKASLVRDCILDKDRKPLKKVGREIFHGTIANKGFPSFYFHSYLYRNDVVSSEPYLTDREIRQIQHYCINNDLKPYLNNKLLFHYYFSNYFSKSGIKLPKLLGYNVGSQFILIQSGRLQSYSDLIKTSTVLARLIKSGYIFLKPVTGGKGKGCIKIDDSSNTSEVKKNIESIQAYSYLFEEGLIQHKNLNELYPHCINSIRMLVCRLKNGSSHLIAAKLRFGQGRMVVDNSSAGGSYVNIDINNGAVNPEARISYQNGGNFISKHPDTGFKFSGFIIPYFQEAKDMVRSASVLIPYKLVGWDVAITKNGPVLIEGNERPHISGSEIAYGGLKKDPVFLEFLNEALEAT